MRAIIFHTRKMVLQLRGAQHLMPLIRPPPQRGPAPQVCRHGTPQLLDRGTGPARSHQEEVDVYTREKDHRRTRRPRIQIYSRNTERTARPRIRQS